MTRVLQFDDPRARDAGLAGGPMATLARLVAAGVPVAPGFVVTSDCGDFDDPEAEAAVFRGYDGLGGGEGRPLRVWVRSSPPVDGTNHPGPEASGHAAASLAELFTAIDACRGEPVRIPARPYARAAACVYSAVGVFRAPSTDHHGFAHVQRAGDELSVAVEIAGPPDGDPSATRVEAAALDEATLTELRECCARISELLAADATIEWVVDSGRPLVVGVHPATPGAGAQQ